MVKLPAMEEEDDAANLESFLQWATEIGISDSDPSAIHWEEDRRLSSCLGYSLIVSHFLDAGGRGLAAARDIRKGELILRVPKDALMTSESLMMKDQTLFSAVKRQTSLSSTQILTIALLNEVNKGRSSWWYLYLKQLPRSYDILASFSQFEIQALQMDDAIWIAEKAAGKAKLEWKEAIVIMVELGFKPALLTLTAWLWASATISSRTMHIHWDDAGCLCPVGDFFNYAAPGDEPCDFENTGTSRNGFLQPIELLDISAGRLTDAGYEGDDDSYCFYARRNYKEKEQVLLSYGMYTNLELLEHYGFLLDANPNDKAFLPLEPDVYSLCSWSKELLYIDIDGKPSFALLSTLRLWATHPNQRRSIGHIAYSGKQLSAENEITVMTGIVKKCRDVLENLTTSAEQDKLLLSTINTIQDSHVPIEVENLPSACTGELRAFFKSNGMTDLDDFANAYMLSRKVRKSMFRWKLAINWRFDYKRILMRCITHCTQIIDDLCLKKSSITD